LQEIEKIDEAEGFAVSLPERYDAAVRKARCRQSQPASTID
jgi:hypothetical protein